jgi:hypothetical protein
MLFQERFRNQIDNSVYITESDLLRFNISIAQLHHFIESGEISQLSNRYKALKAGAVDMALIRRKGATQTELHKWMKQILFFVDLPKDVQTTEYFRMYLKFRNEYLDLFFTVDEFAGRVHTPISSLSHEIRPYLLLCGESTVSLDVCQIQPTLLANILFQNIGENDFSTAIFEGVDVYTKLQEKAGLNIRDEAKKLLFKILFGYPSEQLANIFGDSEWISWINLYKSRTDNRNPHRDKPHTNLAWLLQNSEVQIMNKIWQTLAENRLPFLSVHDEIICRKSDEQKVLSIFNNELSKHFINFKISVK